MSSLPLSISRLVARSLCTLVLFSFLAPRLRAVNPVPYTEGVSFSFRIASAGNATLTVYDETGSPSAVASTSGATTESNIAAAFLRPGKHYAVNFAGTGITNYWLSFVAPAGYGIYVDGAPLDLVAGTHGGGSFSDDHLIELRPVASSARGDAASFSGLEIGKSVSWEIGLGGLRNGRSAGRILFKELDLVTNTPASRERLYYAAPVNLGQITTVFDGVSNQTLRQIGVPQTVVDLVDDNTYGGYWIKFYALSQATWGGASYTFSGSPWKTIRVESPGTSQLKITETEGSVSRVSALTMTSGSVSSGTYVWQLQEGDGSTWLRTSTHTSGFPFSGLRDEVIVTRTGGTSGTIVAKMRYRYVPFSWGEEVTEAVADPDTAGLTTVYDYFTNSGEYGNYRKVKSVTAPTGAWVSYRYYDDWEYRGQLHVETRPWLDSPSTATAAVANVGTSFVYDYVPDFTDRRRIKYTQETRTTDIRTGWVVTSPTLNQTQDTQLYTLYQVDAYPSSSTTLYQRSISALIDSGNGSNNPDFCGQPFSVKRPDQSQDSYAYHFGDFNLTTKVFDPSGAWTHFRTVVFHGTTNSSGADSYTSYAGATVAQIYLIPSRSTKEVTIRNPAGDILRTETHVYTGSGNFALLSAEDSTYDNAGRLLTRVASNGATVTNTYTDGRLTSTVGVDGTESQFTYDVLGRIATSVKKGIAAAGAYAAQGDITTTYTYDGVGNTTQTVSAGGSLSLTTQATYDLAGRLTQSVAPGSYTTSFAYSSGGKVVTATLPGGATKITTSYLDGQAKNVSGTGVVAENYDYGVDSDGRRARQATFGGNTSGWSNVYWDWLGRVCEQRKPEWGGSYVLQTFVYNSAGQLAKETRPGSADTLYLYDSLGRLYRQGLDINANGALDLASDDRVTDTYVSLDTYDSGVVWWAKNYTIAYATSGSSAGTQTGVTFDRLNPASGVLSARLAFDIYSNGTSIVTSVDRTNKKVTTTTDTTDSSTDTVQIVRNGLLVETTDSTGVNFKYGYDALARPNTSVDPRTGTTTTEYVSGTSQVYRVIDPASVAQATYSYDATGRVATVTNGLAKVCRYAYTARGEKYRVWGDTDTPLEYGYNASGQQTTMKTYRGGSGWTGSTWPASPGTADTTTWAYQAATNLLSSKTDAAGKAVAFTYTSAGQLATRAWARILSGSTHVTTTYGYSSTTGELLTVDYNDSTPDVTYTYNRLGQMGTVVDWTGTRTLTYNLSGGLELQREDLANFYSNRRITYPVASSGVVGRSTGLQLGTASAPSAEQATTYGYDAVGRINAIAGGGQSFVYTYTSNSHLIASVTNSGANYTDARSYDATHDWTDNRTASIGSTTKAAFAYTQDNVGRITQVAETGELFNRYGNGTQGLATAFGYDDKSQVTSEQTKLGGTSTVLTGRDDSHSYDPIGNRSSVSHNGNSATYTTNALNQYTQRTVPGVFDVAGAAAAAATVTVNSSSTGVTRHGDYFFKGHALTNTSNPVYTTLAISDGTTTSNLPAFLAKTAEVFTYDDDGNLTSDGRWVYLYDAENRLSWIQPVSTAVAAGHPNFAWVFCYDYLGRRVFKHKYVWSGSTWQTPTPAEQSRYLYQGWNLIAEINGATDTVTRNMFWGLDLSGTGQGAGGVGGLLMTQEGGNSYLPTYDALGNLYGMIKASDGSLAAAYEYDAFGKTLRESGPRAATHPFRHATKYTDTETGLVYYGHRYYSPSMGRFINRDPIEEAGGVNLYGFCANNAVNRYDVLGHYPDASEMPTWIPQEGEIYTGSWSDPNTGAYHRWIGQRNQFDGDATWVTEDQYNQSGHFDFFARAVDSVQVSDATVEFMDRSSVAVWGELSGSIFRPTGGNGNFVAKAGDPIVVKLDDPAPNRGPAGPVVVRGGGARSVPNDNDTILGQAIFATGRIGGQGFTDAVNLASDGAYAALGGLSGFKNVVTLGTSSTAGFDPAAVQTGRSVGITTVAGMVGVGTAGAANVAIGAFSTVGTPAFYSGMSTAAAGAAAAARGGYIMANTPAGQWLNNTLQPAALNLLGPDLGRTFMNGVWQSSSGVYAAASALSSPTALYFGTGQGAIWVSIEFPILRAAATTVQTRP